MIEARELTRRYGPAVAVDGVSFAIGEREIVGMLGPNGAGKTTALRMITGFLPPNEGSVTVAGYDLLEEPRAARRELGYLPENVALYPEMRVEEYLAYRAKLHGMDAAAARIALGETMERCLIADVRRQLIGTLSKGYRQRVGLAQAILHGPRVLVLDEPTVGLDPKQIIAIRELIRELGRERALLLSTHILPEVELLCDRVLIIDRGRIVGEGSPEDLRSRFEAHTQLRVELQGSPPEAADRIAALDEVESVASHPASPGDLLVRAAPGADPRAAVFRTAVDQGWVLLEMAEERASLEDVFVRLTTREDDRDEDLEETLEEAGPGGEEAEAPDLPADERADEGEDERDDEREVAP